MYLWCALGNHHKIKDSSPLLQCPLSESIENIGGTQVFVLGMPWKARQRSIHNESLIPRCSGGQGVIFFCKVGGTKLRLGVTLKSTKFSFFFISRSYDYFCRFFHCGEASGGGGGGNFFFWSTVYQKNFACAACEHKKPTFPWKMDQFLVFLDF